MTPIQIIEVQLVNSKNEFLALENVELDIVFYVNKKERYCFTAGQTNARGQLIITFDDLCNKLKENQKFSLMDYNTKLEDCDSNVLIRIPSLEQLNLRINNLKSWFPDQALEMADRVKNLKNPKDFESQTQCSLVGNLTLINIFFDSNN